MLPTDRADLRALSRVVFGQEHRIELMIMINEAEDRIVTLGEVADQLNVSVSSLQKPWQATITAGLLSPLPSEGSRKKYFQVNDSPAWAWVLQLAEMLARRRDFSQSTR